MVSGVRSIDRCSCRGRTIALIPLVAVGLLASRGAILAQEASPRISIAPYTPATGPGQLDGDVVVDGSSTGGPTIDEVAIRFREPAPGVTA